MTLSSWILKTKDGVSAIPWDSPLLYGTTSSEKSQNEPPKLQLKEHCPLYRLYYAEEFAAITFATPFQIGC